MSRDAAAPVEPIGIGRRGAAAAIGLAIAGVAAPIAVAVVAAATGGLGPPLAASAMVALLVLAPAGVGLAAALTGLRRTAASPALASDNDAEQAVLRVFIDTLVFFYAVGVAALAGNARPTPVVPVAALAVVAAWAVLLHVILWPVSPPWRRYGAMALDVLLFSAFLHFGGGEVAGWYPLYLVAILHSGLRFGRTPLLATALASIAGFAAVVLTTEFWRQQPALAVGLGGALVVLPGVLAAMLRVHLPSRLATAAGGTPPLTYPEHSPSGYPVAAGFDEAPAEPYAPRAAGRITPIAAHPKFGADAGTVDPRAIDELRALGGGPDFLREVYETFRADTERIMAGIDQAVAAGNAAGFARGLVALRRAAGHLGDTQLGELAASLQGLDAAELRRQGAFLVQRLDAEIERLAAGLEELLPAGNARLL